MLPIILALLCSLLFGWVGIASPFVPFVMLLVSLFFMYCFISPKKFVFAFLIFILFQRILAYWLGGKMSLLGTLVTYFDEFITLGLAISLFMAFISRQGRWSCNFQWPLAVMTFLGITGGVISGSPVNTLLFGTLIFLKVFLFFFFVHMFVYPEQMLAKWVKLMAVISVIILLLGAVDAVGLNLFEQVIINRSGIEWRFGIPSIKSIFVHPGQFGWFCCFIALFFMAFYYVFHKKKFLWLASLFFLGIIFSVRLKPLFGFFLATIIGTFALSLKHRVAMNIRLIMIGGVFLIIFFIPLIKLVNQQAKTYVFVQTPDKVARNSLYSTSLKIAKDYFPFGVGFGQYGGTVAADFYSPIYRKYNLDRVWGLARGQNFSMDTFWPMILGELGIIGLLLYLWICWNILCKCWMVYRKMETPFLKAFSLGTLMIFVEALVESVAQPVFFSPPEAYWIFACVGIVYSLGASTPTERYS